MNKVPVEDMIGVGHGVRKRLSEVFDVSEPAVSEALRFKRNSLRARKIRSYAVNILGGYYLSFQ